MSGPDESHAELAARITRGRFPDEIEDLIFDGPPSQAKVELVADSLGLPSRLLANEIERRLLAEDRVLEARPFTEEELEAAQLTPPWLVEHYLYRNVAVLCAPGGYSKTTIVGLGVDPHRPWMAALRASDELEQNAACHGRGQPGGACGASSGAYVGPGSIPGG